MQTYSDAYQQVKNGPWKDFFATQNQLESVNITFSDGTMHRIWLEYYQLPKVDSRTNTKPNLPVLSISYFLERIMDAITEAFYIIGGEE